MVDVARCKNCGMTVWLADGGWTGLPTDTLRATECFKADTVTWPHYPDEELNHVLRFEHGFSELWLEDLIGWWRYLKKDVYPPQFPVVEITAKESVGLVVVDTGVWVSLNEDDADHVILGLWGDQHSYVLNPDDPEPADRRYLADQIIEMRVR